MKTVEMWFWDVPHERKPGKRRRSACLLTREDAEATYGTDILPIENTKEVRQLATTDAERLANTNTGKHLRKPPGMP